MLVFQPLGWKSAPLRRSRVCRLHCESCCMSSHHDHQKGLLLTAIGGLTLTVDIPLIRLADGERLDDPVAAHRHHLRRGADHLGRSGAR